MPSPFPLYRPACLHSIFCRKSVLARSIPRCTRQKRGYDGRRRLSLRDREERPPDVELLLYRGVFINSRRCTVCRNRMKQPTSGNETGRCSHYPKIPLSDIPVSFPKIAVPKSELSPSTKRCRRLTTA
ncbi:hypothetical protein C8J56DRAFT_1168399 [Mycena floridula]|nr:hypothetical protein C8J56DRAFT_1168399 [Mycena floridula]